MAKIDPPWWFDIRLIPRRIHWGGCFVLLQFFAQKGDVQIEPQIKGCKVVYSRNENTPNGYEGIFLLSLGGFPKANENSGIAPASFVAKLKGVPDDITPPNDFCGATTISINYERYLTHFPIGFIPQQTQVWERKTTSINDPNGYQEGTFEYQLAGVTADDVTNVPPGESVTSHTIWYPDPNHPGKYIDTHQPCATYNPDPPKITFSCGAWIFPHARHKVRPADTYFPIRREDGVHWSETYIWELKAHSNDLSDGDYPFIVQKRKFRAFDLPTDHDGDLPPLKEPFTAEDVQKRDAENKKRFDARHMMLQLWPEAFRYDVRRFRYPVFRPKQTNPNEPLPPPPVNPAVQDAEWYDVPGGIDGPPPVLQTKD